MNVSPATISMVRHDTRGQAVAANQSLPGWWERRAGRIWELALGVLILVMPVWLWFDPLDGFALWSEGLSGMLARFQQMAIPFGGTKLVSDDFFYLAGSRTLSDFEANLWKPHNSHVVPLFRAWTLLWGQLAGNLARAAATFAWASVLTWLGAMLLVWRLVGRESGSPALGLASMAVFGVSAVLEETVRWYSAGQAIAAGVTILAMLVCLQGWRIHGGAWRLAVAAGWVVAAPLVWTIGLIAGPVGFAYLWADGRSQARRVAVVPLVATIAVAALIFGMAGQEVTAPKNFHDRSLSEAANPTQGLISTMQAVIEILVLRNLGLVAETTPAQAAGLLALGLGAWVWTRGRPWKLNPLEAAGGAIVVLGGLLVYTARGYYPFEQLRVIHWYQAVPQTGGILFAAGWWSGRSAGVPVPPRRATRKELGLVLSLLVVVLIVQTPRAQANLVGSVPSRTASERLHFPIPRLQRLRARYLRTEEANWQQRTLARVDLAEAQAQREGWGRAAIRSAIGGSAGPRITVGMGRAPGFDPVDLMALPEVGRDAAPEVIRSALLPLLTPEPERPPPWLAPGERWPPPSEDG